MSIKVSIASDYPLEGVLRENEKRAGVVICHPHPLYGGNMHNNVVDAMDRGFSAKGFTTLRFNFRGVGMSEGIHDEGEGEVRDAIASLAFLKQQIDADAYVMIAGYSFGAWVASRVSIQVDNIDGLFLVGYPFAFREADELRQFKKSIYIIGAEHDDKAPLDTILKVYKDLPIVEKNLKIIPTDHFYSGKEQEIIEFIKENV